MKTFTQQVFRECCILYHLKGENVPKCTEQFLCASSFLRTEGFFNEVLLNSHDEFCLCPWLCIFLLRKHTDFCQTFRLRRDADWGGFGWREILFDRFLNHNLMEKNQTLTFGESKRNYFLLAKKYRKLTSMCFFHLKHLKKSVWVTRWGHYIDDFGTCTAQKQYWAGSFWSWCPRHDHNLVRLGQLGVPGHAR